MGALPQALLSQKLRVDSPSLGDEHFERGYLKEDVLRLRKDTVIMELWPVGWKQGDVGEKERPSSGKDAALPCLPSYAFSSSALVLTHVSLPGCALTCFFPLVHSASQGVSSQRNTCSLRRRLPEL